MKRKRFERSEPHHPLTPKKLQIMLDVAELGICTTSQISLFSGLSKPAVYNHLLDLYHLGLLDRTAVSRDALLPANAPYSPTAAFGVSENIHYLTKEGANSLVQAHLLSKEDIADLPEFDRRKALFLAHELEIRDVRVWLERLKRRHNHRGLTYWMTGSKAAFGPVRPDAWFTYEVAAVPHLFFVEIDRGTEKSPSRWQEKAHMYTQLYSSSLVKQTTGIACWKVLVFAPDDRRVNELWKVISQEGRRAELPELTFWITKRTTLEIVDLSCPVWAVARESELLTFLPLKYVAD